MTGSDVYQLRSKAQIPQGVLAERAGLTQARLCRIEKGKAPLSSEMAAKLVSALHNILAEYALVGVEG
jgi:predicted transcriptional regulator